MILDHLTLVGKDKTRTDAVRCVSLAHNEGNILAPFLQHYRRFGNIDFLIVDDHSTDSSRDFLQSQPDVTLFSPIAGSRYDLHKVYWRRELLDTYSQNSWCLVPDIDEHFVFSRMEGTPFSAFLFELKDEGVDAVLTAMVDMYGELPLADHVFSTGSLSDAFPLFDSPETASLGYRLIAPPPAYRSHFPSPAVMVFGGMRERLFVRARAPLSRWQRTLVDRFAAITDPLQPSCIQLSQHSIARLATNEHFDGHRFKTSKLGMIRWRRGFDFSGGAHAVNCRVRISKRLCAFLHFPVTRGVDGIEYVANRGQHSRGSYYYKRMLHAEKLLRRSAVCEISQRYVSSSSLGPLLR